jgi:hypothetical protein
MCFINIRFPNADSRILLLVVNLATILAALWLVSDASLSNSELITDPGTRDKAKIITGVS